MRDQSLISANTHFHRVWMGVSANPYASRMTLPAYTVTRKPVKYTRIRVSPPDGRVTVTAPRHVSAREIERFVADKAAWISGVRRSDSTARQSTRFVLRDRNGLVKLNPLAGWSDEDVATYATIHEVPLNPLIAQGYPSIGCWPCTQRPVDPDDPRSGRWVNRGKTECGLHL